MAMASLPSLSFSSWVARFRILHKCRHTLHLIYYMQEVLPKGCVLPAWLHAWLWLGFSTESLVVREIHVNLYTKTGIVQLPIPFPNLMYISPPLSIIKTHLHSLRSAMCALHLTHISMHMPNVIFTHYLSFYISLRAEQMNTLINLTICSYAIIF